MIEFVEWLTGTHECACGAKYAVTVTGVPTGSVSCEKCGTLMDSRANQSFLTYARIPADERAPEMGRHGPEQRALQVPKGGQN